MTAERRVRIVLDALVVPAGHRPEVLRVRQDNGSVTYVDTTAPGVTVEDVAPAPVWSEGDVVQADDLVVFWRGARLWSGLSPAGDAEYMTDDEVTAAGYSVLRYQGGQ